MDTVTYNELQEEFKELDVVFSVFATVHYGEKWVVTNCKTKVAVEGKCKFVSSDWYEKKYESPIVTNPTWKDVAYFADASIKTTGDYHHIYFEGLLLLSEIDGVKTFRLEMGS